MMLPWLKVLSIISPFMKNMKSSFIKYQITNPDLLVEQNMIQTFQYRLLFLNILKSIQYLKMSWAIMQFNFSFVKFHFLFK